LRHSVNSVTPSEVEDNTRSITKSRFAILLFSDIVGSTDLKALHGVPIYRAALQTHNGHFERIARECRGIRILQNMGDGYFAEAEGVADAVKFALLFQQAMRVGPWEEIALTTRVGIHAGEVTALDAEGGSGIVAPAADLAARVMSLAIGGQILLTRFPFDEARHFLREHPPIDRETPPLLRWLAHGPYLLKGRAEPMEVFEVGAEGLAPLVAPPDGEKAKRVIRPGEEETLGWRPAVGLEIPGRAGWNLVALLGAGGFGEVWVGEHAKLHQRRAFKFCFDEERLRALKREVTLTSLLRTALGARDDIVRIHELKLDAPPFFLESDLAPHGNLLQWAAGMGGLEKVPLVLRIALVARSATALDAAHSVGVLHKDIKPTNILIFDGPDGEPRPRLVDFGIGTLADPAVLGQFGVTSAGFTHATIQHSTGTPTYSPPEYLAGKPYTIQGDIYGLGVLLYQLITLKPLDPLAPGWERDISDPLLREDIAACVDGDPSRRLPRAADLADRLTHLTERRAQMAEKDRLKQEAEKRARNRRKRRMVMGLALLALICAAGGWFSLRLLTLSGPSSVEIASEPTGAAVWRDGHQVGVTPFAEEHRIHGQVTYVLKAEGYEEYVYVGKLSPTRLLSVTASLRKTAPQDPTVIPGEGQLLEIQNSVDFAPRGGQWSPARLGVKLQAGDKIRTGEHSRATVRLPGGGTLRLDELTTIEITLPPDKAPDSDGSATPSRVLRG
jgi:serine/threonine protein kinase/class 3 adenylate cyclase